MNRLRTSCTKRAGWYLGLAIGFVLQSLIIGAPVAAAQTTPAARQIGSVKTISPNKLTITTDAGVSISVNVVDGAKVLQLAPGSTDLKTAQSIALNDIEVGDRVLVTGHQDAPDALTASRVILMKSSDITQKHEAEQADWQKRGSGGLVSAVDPSTGTLTITTRGRKMTVATGASTIFRRYADGSVKFEDAKIGTLAQIQVGDQLRVRGERLEDGTSIKAEEVVTGSFRNLAGTIVAIDESTNTLTLKDIASKTTYSIKVTANSSVRLLPAEAAARFATRARGSQGGAAGAPGAAAKGSDRPSPAAAGAAGDGHSPQGGPGGAGADLSQLINRLPQATLAALHPGDALMVVGEQAQAGGNSVTAITVLSGVEPILAATPKGESSMTLSPWNVGGPEGGGGA